MGKIIDLKICFVQYNLGATSETFLTRHINLLKPYSDVYCITGKVHDNTVLNKSKVYEYTKLNYLESAYNRLRFRLNKRSYIYSNKIYRSINQIKPDLIVFQFGFIPVLLEKELHKIKYPYIVIHHGTDVNRARKDIKYHKKLLNVWKHASKIIFISNFLKKVGLELGCPNKKMEVIPLGIPLNCSNEISGKRIDDNKFKILTVGRLVPVKNHEFLIRAFSIFIKKKPNASLYIIGGGTDEAKLKLLVEDLNLRNDVYFLGSLPFQKVKKHLGDCDVVCLVSKKVTIEGVFQEEGLGLSLVEGATFRKPIIGSSSGGISEIIEHQKTGLLVESDNLDELVNALEFISENPKEAKEMGENAFEFAQDNFDQNKQIIKFKEIYEGVIEQHFSLI